MFRFEFTPINGNFFGSFKEICFTTMNSFSLKMIISKAKTSKHFQTTFFKIKIDHFCVEMTFEPYLQNYNVNDNQDRDWVKI